MVINKLRYPTGDIIKLRLTLHEDYVHGMKLNVVSLDDAYVHLNRVCQSEGFRIINVEQLPTTLCTYHANVAVRHIIV